MRKSSEQSKAKKKESGNRNKTKEENAESPTRSQLRCARYQYAIFLVKGGPKKEPPPTLFELWPPSASHWSQMERDRLRSWLPAGCSSSAEDKNLVCTDTVWTPMPVLSALAAAPLRQASVMTCSPFQRLAFSVQRSVFNILVV